MWHVTCRNATQICMCGHTHDAVIYYKFHRNPFRGFGAPRVLGTCIFPLLWSLWLLQQFFYTTIQRRHHWCACGTVHAQPLQCRDPTRWRCCCQGNDQDADAVAYQSNDRRCPWRCPSTATVLSACRCQTILVRFLTTRSAPLPTSLCRSVNSHNIYRVVQKKWYLSYNVM